MNRPTADSCCHHPPSSCLWAASIRARSQHRYTYLARQPSLKKKQTGNTNLRTPHHHGRDASHRHPSNSIRNLQTGRHTSPGSIATVRTASHIRKNIGISKKCILTNPNVWAKMDSNHRRRTPADLQSAPFGHSGICPPLFCDAKVSIISETAKRSPPFLWR